MKMMMMMMMNNDDDDDYDDLSRLLGVPVFTGLGLILGLLLLPILGLLIRGLVIQCSQLQQCTCLIDAQHIREVNECYCSTRF